VETVGLVRADLAEVVPAIILTDSQEYTGVVQRIRATILPCIVIVAVMNAGLDIVHFPTVFNHVAAEVGVGVDF